MSGRRLKNFREGDRSEYLATYLLSGVGLVTQVPRQEDIGFDLVCQLSDQESGLLSFGGQFLVSVKSLSQPHIDAEPTSERDTDLSHISWLFQQSAPIFLAVADKDAGDVRLYSTLPKWFIYYENPDCGSLRLVPRVAANDADIGRPTRQGQVKLLPGTSHYDVDLGHPIARLDANILKDAATLRRMKSQIRLAVYFGQLAIMFYRLEVPVFHWFARTSPDATEAKPAYYFRAIPTQPEVREKVLRSIGPILISLALCYRETGMSDQLAALLLLLREAPKDAIPQNVRDHLGL